MTYLEKVKKLKAIKYGKGIQHILDEAYKILGNPILTHDMDNKVIAYSENPIADDPIWNEFEATGMVGYDRLIFYRDECFFEVCANAEKITFLVSDKLKYDRIFGKLFTKNKVQVGCVCMVECCTSFEDDTPKLFEMVCDILNKVLCQSEFFQNHGLTYMDTLVGKLINNNIEDISILTAHIESIYNGTKGFLYLGVVDITQCDPEHVKLAYFRDLFMQKRPAFKYIIYSNFIIILMSTDYKSFNAKRDLKGLYDLFEQNNICIGVSNEFENIYELQKNYAEAVTALEYGMAHNDSNQRVFSFNKYNESTF